jgi:ABC-type multidrug transport system fused ATPase/permease subunit
MQKSRDMWSQWQVRLTIILHSSNPNLTRNSGKSSLILCLLNLIDITHGSLKIDGIDIGQLKKEDLRQRLTVVPQHSLLLPGSVRFNVDPEARYGDEEIIECLEKVQLWTVFSENGGLSFKLDSAALSQGQKQLLCLARAMLSCRGQKLLILDEATSRYTSHPYFIKLRCKILLTEACVLLLVWICKLKS